MSERERTILVVDDAPENIQLLSGLLKVEYKVKAATSGEKALVVAARQPAPDLVLLDVMMPEMDGYEVCRRLRDDPATRDIPVVFVTGHSSDEERAQGLALGAAGFLVKPVDPEVLFSTVREIFGQAQE